MGGRKGIWVGKASLLYLVMYNRGSNSSKDEKLIAFS